MSLPWVVVLLGGLTWGIVWVGWDSPAIPLWRTRAAYRLLILGLWGALMLLAWKAEQWHLELVQVIAGCR